MGEIFESAFTKFARLEAAERGGEELDAEAAEPPPAPAGRRPGAKKRRPCLGACFCRGRKAGSSATTMPPPAEIANNRRQRREFNTAISIMCRELTAAKSDNTSDEEVLDILKCIDSGSDDEPEAPRVLCSFYVIENAAHEACVLEEPEFIATEMTREYECYDPFCRSP